MTTTADPLADYGWDEGREAEDDLTALREAGLVPGRVARVDLGACDVVVADGPGVRALRTDALPGVCTGDWVMVDPHGSPRPTQAQLLPRRTAIVRGAADGGSQGQVLAANIDTVLIAASLAAEIDLARIERYLTLAWDSGAHPVVVLTKADVAYDPEVQAAVQATAPGATVLTVSVVTGEGLDPLRALTAGATTALIGPSGVGKSSLTNALTGGEAMAVGETREADEKGRHTTTTRQLIPLPGGGVLIDTPGLRGVALSGAEDGLSQTFSDIEELAGDCRFNDCSHEAEPGCAVLAAVEAGDLPERRLASYRKLLRENEWMASRSDARLAAERTKVWKTRSKEARANGIRP
ncbi:ribosome small subunit-dependent GTPase A [Catenulispora subtropica]|uniref:Small ribosomal subunit biogenesis GTPase RsgA n=1 Tax=Catenulispora subtropica TaxID=450798 RepID=A0ABP5EEW0_9ACTN